MNKRGLCIVVGGTGSGKSTTLAAMIGHRNENSKGHIVSIEDPVEYVHPHKGCVITQREVGVDTETWHAALKNTLRQAPDVILIGEIRDRETMEYGIQFSETGHLCLATLHANSDWSKVCMPRRVDLAMISLIWPTSPLKIKSAISGEFSMISMAAIRPTPVSRGIRR